MLGGGFVAGKGVNPMANYYEQCNCGAYCDEAPCERCKAEQVMATRPPANFPRIGSLWKHYKGTVYEVVSSCRCCDTGNWMVIYRSTEENDPIRWVRSLTSWLDIMGDDSPRFRLVEDAP
jgi:hypothetical protein